MTGHFIAWAEQRKQRCLALPGERGRGPEKRVQDSRHGIGKAWRGLAAWACELVAVLYGNRRICVWLSARLRTSTQLLSVAPVSRCHVRHRLTVHNPIPLPVGWAFFTRCLVGWLGGLAAVGSFLVVVGESTSVRLVSETTAPNSN